MEIERKFLISEELFIKLINNFPFDLHRIRQFYIHNDEDREVRIRSINNQYFNLTVKDKGDLVREEIENFMTQKDFLLYKEKSLYGIEKLRFQLFGLNLPYAIFLDKIVDENLKSKGAYFMEIEFGSIEDADQFRLKILPFDYKINDIIEVTFDPLFKNSNIAKENKENEKNN